ncbi:MAG: DUF169 domain-containing protein [Chloroflexi bacterium]|nr:DUF169 domain-containing protein [Chloroflexota bacterium]
MALTKGSETGSSVTTVQQMYGRMIKSMEIKGLDIPLTAVKFYKLGKEIPDQVMENHPSSITLTSCQVTRQASLGDAVLLTLDNIGCIAAAISLGLVDQNQSTPFDDSRVYTDIMRDQSGLESGFEPPTPQDFTKGLVYACHDADRPDFCLFGKEDQGRFKDTETAKRAIADMVAIQPPVMQGVFFYSPDYDDLDLTPDVVVLNVRPVELTRIIQAYQYNTGKRVTASMGGLRAVNSDLIACPYLTQDINISPYCLGARLIAQYEADRMGIGMPFDIFEVIVRGMEDSKTGFPFSLYPEASNG